MFTFRDIRDFVLNALPNALGGIIATAILALVAYLYTRLRKRWLSNTRKEPSSRVQDRALPEQKKLSENIIITGANPKKIYHNLYQPFFSDFIGRETEIAIIQKLLLPSSHHSLITICGIGGIGKTALAMEIACRYLQKYDELSTEEFFDAIIWASAKPTILTANGIEARPKIDRTLDDIYRAIAEVLGREDITKAYPNEKDEAVRRALKQQRTLLIMDNMDTVDDRVTAFLRELPLPTKAILTTPSVN